MQQIMTQPQIVIAKVEGVATAAGPYHLIERGAFLALEQRDGLTDLRFAGLNRSSFGRRRCSADCRLGCRLFRHGPCRSHRLSPRPNNVAGAAAGRCGRDPLITPMLHLPPKSNGKWGARESRLRAPIPDVQAFPADA
mgnify:CR=1 FL=1